MPGAIDQNIIDLLKANGSMTTNALRDEIFPDASDWEASEKLHNVYARSRKMLKDG